MRHALVLRRAMFESFVTTFINYFVVIEQIQRAGLPDCARGAGLRPKLRTALKGTAIANAIMLLFALCGA